MPLLEEIEEPITAEDEEELGPGLDPSELNGRLEHSRIAGDYYRDLATNYAFYEQQAHLFKQTGGEEGQDWPEHPFPNEKYTEYIITE